MAVKAAPLPIGACRPLEGRFALRRGFAWGVVFQFGRGRRPLVFQPGSLARFEVFDADAPEAALPVAVFSCFVTLGAIHAVATEDETAALQTSAGAPLSRARYRLVVTDPTEGDRVYWHGRLALLHNSE